MLNSVINGFTTYIINNIDGFDANNCKGFDDESVFDYIIATDLSPYPQQGCILSYGGSRKNPNLPSEFGSMIVDWIIIVNGLFPLSGSQEEVQTQINTGYAFVDSLFEAVVADSTLSGTVMDVQLIDSEPPMEYNRNATDYILMSFRFAVTENM